MKRKTNEQFVKELHEVNPNLIPLEEYTISRKKLLIQCTVCGEQFSALPTTLVMGIGCPHCSNRMPKQQQSFVDEMNSIDQSIIIKGQYVNNHTKLEVQCGVCCNTWFARPNALLRGQGCPYCHGHIRKTHKQFMDEMSIRHPELVVLSEYQNNHTKIDCQCIKCGTVFSVTPHSLLDQNTSCPVCRVSKGEIKIAKYLSDNNIPYIPQKTFEDLKGVGGHKLLYDFFLPQYNLLIEFQGIQHEQPIDFGGKGYDYSADAFDIQKEHDERKRNYAIQNGYKLLEIWYYDINNIENILNKEFCIELVS